MQAARGLSSILAATSGPSFLPHQLQLASASFQLLASRWASAIPQKAFPDQFQDPHETFRASDIEYQLTQTPSTPRTNLEDVKFGTVFTDHMLLIEHTEDQGWTRPLVRPFGYLQLHPAAQVLHYGMTCFEGMKAYKGPDGQPRLFRPHMNMARLARSAARLQLAPFNPNELLECIKSLILVDKDWIPTSLGHSLYLRPFLFSSAHVLGVSKATATTLSVLMSPVGPYFPSGMRPISLFVEETTKRAWPGGVGAYKVGGNYAPTIQPQVSALASHGAQQVVYTFSTTGTREGVDAGGEEEDGRVQFEECGAMNIFFLFEKKEARGGMELVTPSLDRGTILPGITRDSILSLTREWGEFEVSERPVTVAEVKSAAKEGRLREIFGSGTACIVQPVNALVREDGETWIPTVIDPGMEGALAPKVQKQLMDIQHGLVENHPWSVVV